MQAKKAKTKDDAWNMQNAFEGVPHGWIQWKGTDVCMDVHCKCGAHLHFDCSFAYHIKCNICHAVYFCSGYIELIELEEEPDGCVQLPNEDEDHDVIDSVGVDQEPLSLKAAQTEE